MIGVFAQVVVPGEDGGLPLVSIFKRIEPNGELVSVNTTLAVSLEMARFVLIKHFWSSSGRQLKVGFDPVQAGGEEAEVCRGGSRSPLFCPGEKSRAFHKWVSSPTRYVKRGGGVRRAAVVGSQLPRLCLWSLKACYLP